MGRSSLFNDPFVFVCLSLPPARLNAATNEAMKDLIIATNDHVDEFKALSQQLKSLVREVKKTAEYFLVLHSPILAHLSSLCPSSFF